MVVAVKVAWERPARLALMAQAARLPVALMNGYISLLLVRRGLQVVPAAVAQVVAAVAAVAVAGRAMILAALPAVAVAAAAGVQAAARVPEVELLSLFWCCQVRRSSPSRPLSLWVAALGLLERLVGSAALVAMVAVAATVMMTLEKAARAATAVTERSVERAALAAVVRVLVSGLPTGHKGRSQAVSSSSGAPV